MDEGCSGGNSKLRLAVGFERTEVGQRHLGESDTGFFRARTDHLLAHRALYRGRGVSNRAAELDDGKRHEQQYGEFTVDLLLIAEYDPERARRVYERWLLTELLDKIEHAAKTAAVEQYRYEMVLWALLAPHAKKGTKQPELPRILRER